MRDALIKEIMVTKVITVNMDEPFSHVEEKLRVNHIRHLPVVNGAGVLVGIITQLDLYRALTPRETDEGFSYDPDVLDEFILKHFMTKDPHTLGPEDFISQAVKVMAEFKYGCIPIVKPDKTLLGIVTQIDILKYLAKYL